MSKKQRRTLATWLRPLVFAMLLAATQVLFLPSLVQAQGAKEEEEETKSWVIPYSLVVSAVGLGLLAICRPGQRQDDLPLKK